MFWISAWASRRICVMAHKCVPQCPPLQHSSSSAIIFCFTWSINTHYLSVDWKKEKKKTKQTQKDPTTLFLRWNIFPGWHFWCYQWEKPSKKMGIKPETLHNAELKDKVFSRILIFFKQLPLSEHSHHCYKIFKASYISNRDIVTRANNLT